MNTHIALNKLRSSNTSSTATSYRVSTKSVGGESTKIPNTSTSAPKKTAASFDKAVENAVYGYIRAIRALGRTDVNTAEIAKALAIPLKQVDLAASKLRNKGVKPRQNMVDHVKIPIKIIRGEKWGDLSSLSLTHRVCGETVHRYDDFSFAGEHRVRLYGFKKNVHWKTPEGTPLDVSAVSPQPPRRRKK